MRLKAAPAALLGILLAPCALAPLPVHAQTSGTRATVRPPETPRMGAPRAPLQLGGAEGEEIADGTPLTESQVLERMSRLYRYQSDILMAEARGDSESVDALFTLAMTELGRLSRQEGLLASSVGVRFREVYRSLVNEYEKYYAVSPEDAAIQRGDVFDLRADIFAALNDDQADPQLGDVLRPQQIQQLRATETTIPMPMNRLVESSIAYLMRSPDRHLYRWVERSETYFPMIEQIFAEEGAPDELKYLAMIESGLNPRAQSWAAAGGMWQFIRATGAAYGLQVNANVDERMDPEKATRAAARHLKDLYNQYGQDWHLAIAGYNCSPRCINGAIRKARARGVAQPTFWDIYNDIPKETRNYVPMFIAAALLASNPSALDQSKITPGPRYEYDVVPVRGALTLARAAEMAGTNEDVLRALNPELKRPSVPSVSGYYPLRLPVGTGRSLASAAGSSIQLAQADMRTVQFTPNARLRIAASNRSDAPARRASAPAPTRRAETPRANPRTDPIVDEPTPTPIRTVSSSGAEARTDRTRTTAARTVAKRETNTRVVYRVRRGDTLAGIARKYGVTMGQVRQWNDMSGSGVQSGQRLVLYAAGSAPAEEAEARPAARTRTAPRAVAARTHTVTAGQTLAAIGRRYGVSVANLRAWNDISGSNIQPGQRLKVSGGAASGARTASRAPATYRVKAGDNLTEIARAHNVSVSDLRAWNNIRGSNIRPGQRLKLRG